MSFSAPSSAGLLLPHHLCLSTSLSKGLSTYICCCGRTLGRGRWSWTEALVSSSGLGPSCEMQEIIPKLSVTGCAISTCRVCSGVSRSRMVGPPGPGAQSPGPRVGGPRSQIARCWDTGTTFRAGQALNSEPVSWPLGKPDGRFHLGAGQREARFDTGLQSRPGVRLWLGQALGAQDGPSSPSS